MAGEREQRTIYLPVELEGQLQAEAEKRGESLKELVMSLINAALKRIKHDNIVSIGGCHD